MCLCPLLTGAERQLFNGKDLTGWARIPRHEDAPKDQQPGFVVKDGMLVAIPAAPEDDLWFTGEKIGNATLRVVYKVSAPSANSGVFIRIPVQPKSEDDAINKGIEVQIDESGDDFHCSGVLYSMTQAKARPYKPAGEWNTLEITMKGQRTTVMLNGVLVTDYDGVGAGAGQEIGVRTGSRPAARHRLYRDPAPRRGGERDVQGNQPAVVHRRARCRCRGSFVMFLSLSRRLTFVRIKGCYGKG